MNYLCTQLPLNAMNFVLDPTQWIDRYADYLFSYAYLRLNHRETAEDIVQDTFLSAYKARTQFKGNSHEKTWLTAILKHKIADYYRQKNDHEPIDRYLEQTQDSFRRRFFDDPKHQGRWTTRIAPTLTEYQVETHINSIEFSQTLLQCLGKMPPKLHQIFTAKYIDDTDSEQICKDFAISSSNYWVIIHRAKVLLRACLAQYGFFAP
ncbi:MAG: sigma-70 family RNA polymerase sigma factor [Chitinophagales bacterium]|jgi:RNA polymerase sigma-70 factor (TIGR02943 family)|nr:sigma-70 family RNA polymerase sigma factor [Chitinophagales bacterium]